MSQSDANQNIYQPGQVAAKMPSCVASLEPDCFPWQPWFMINWEIVSLAMAKRPSDSNALEPLRRRMQPHHHKCDSQKGLPIRDLDLTTVLHRSFNFNRLWSQYSKQFPGEPGAEVFRRKRTIKQRKKLPIECAQGDEPVRCPKPSFLCARAFSRSMVVMCRDGDVTCFDVMRLVAG